MLVPAHSTRGWGRRRIGFAARAVHTALALVATAILFAQPTYAAEAIVPAAATAGPILQDASPAGVPASAPAAATGAAHAGATAPQPATARLSTPPQLRGGRDFLFRPPNGSIGVRAGYGFARATSEIFDHTVRHLTVERGDFDSALLGVDVAARLTPRLDALLGFGYLRTRTDSEFRDFIGEDDLPIEQSTDLLRLPVTASVKLYVTPPGRAIGRFAWIPARVAPFIGAGGGVMRYRFEQDGEFVDFEDLSIFRDSFVARGWTPTGHVFGGLDLRLGTRAVLSTEARYQWASGEMGRDFDGFDRLDLSGLQTSVGVHWRF